MKVRRVIVAIIAAMFAVLIGMAVGAGEAAATDGAIVVEN